MGRHSPPGRPPPDAPAPGEDLTTASTELEDAPTAAGGRRTTRIALLIIVAVLTVLGVEVAYLLRSSPGRPAPSTAVPTSAASSVISTQGWIMVQDTDSHATYLVPPTFTVQDDLKEMTFGQVLREAPDRVDLHAISIYQDGSCPGPDPSHRGLAGFVSATPDRSDDPAAVAAAAARQAITHRDGTAAQVPVPRSSRITLADGTVAHEAVVSVPVTEAYPCSPPAIKVTVAALPVRGETVLFLLATDDGTDTALPEDQRRQIVRSVAVPG